MSNYSKTKAEALKRFKDECNNFPLWSLWELGKRNPIYSNFTEGDESKTIKVFEQALGDLYPDKIYTVKMFRDLRHRKGGQKFIAPNVEYSFQFERVEAHPPAVNGVTNQPPVGQYVPPQSPYAVDTGQRINLADHVTLIQRAAKAEADCAYWMGVVAERDKTIVTLNRELEELEQEFDKLEEEMEEMEADADEEEKAKISGDEKTTMESAIASVIKENGGALLENLFDKGVKGAPKFTEEQLNGADDEEDKKVVNGISVEDISLDDLNKRMMAMNPKWKSHLYKMVLIGEQKPSTFKMFMNRLEAY